MYVVIYVSIIFHELNTLCTLNFNVCVSHKAIIYSFLNLSQGGVILGWPITSTCLSNDKQQSFRIWRVPGIYCSWSVTCERDHVS